MKSNSFYQSHVLSQLYWLLSNKVLFDDRRQSLTKSHLWYPARWQSSILETWLKDSLADWSSPSTVSSPAWDLQHVGTYNIKRTHCSHDIYPAAASLSKKLKLSMSALPAHFNVWDAGLPNPDEPGILTNTWIPNCRLIRLQHATP